MTVVMLCVAYLSGSIPFGLILGKMKGIDIRQYGSGNIGTSNVARILGKKAAIATLLGDGLKGLLPVLLARMVIGNENMWPLIATGLAAVIGHNWPIWLRFKGGKGVTTTYGAFLGITWLPALVTILVWVLVSKLTHKASLAALISSPCAPLFAWLAGMILRTPALPALVFGLIACALIYIRHIANIQRLLAGTELRQDQKIATDRSES